MLDSSISDGLSRPCKLKYLAAGAFAWQVREAETFSCLSHSVCRLLGTPLCMDVSACEHRTVVRMVSV